MKSSRQFRDEAMQAVNKKWSSVVKIQLRVSITDILVIFLLSLLILIPKVGIIIYIICLLAYYFFAKPCITMWCKNAYYTLFYLQKDENEAFEGYSVDTGKTIGLYLLKNLIIIAGCLLIIPGVIFSYMYSMSYFIILDNPNLSVVECMKKSREMMQGRKWNLFCMHFSFIGWFLLFLLVASIVTFSSTFLKGIPIFGGILNNVLTTLLQSLIFAYYAGSVEVATLDYYSEIKSNKIKLDKKNNDKKQNETIQSKLKKIFYNKNYQQARCEKPNYSGVDYGYSTNVRVSNETKIRLNDIFYADSNADLINKLFLTNYTEWKSAIWPKTPNTAINDKYALWMIYFNEIKTSGWVKTYEGDRIKSEKVNPNLSDNGRQNDSSSLSKYKIVMSIEDTRLGKRYVFKGVYRYNKRLSSNFCRYYDKISDEFII